MTCPGCRKRRGKRACPARGEPICSQCCGTMRRVEIDCPPGCAFLDGAQAGAWDGRSAQRDRDARRVAPFLEGLSEAQGRLVLLFLVGTAAIRARRRDLDDRLLLEAVRALLTAPSNLSVVLVTERLAPEHAVAPSPPPAVPGPWGAAPSCAWVA